MFESQPHVLDFEGFRQKICSYFWKTSCFDRKLLRYSFIHTTTSFNIFSSNERRLYGWVLIFHSWYVEQRSGFGCENKGDMTYHGISSCTDVPKGLFFEKEPNNYKDIGEWCVESREYKGERGLNSRNCDFTGVDFVVCQINRNCAQ